MRRLLALLILFAMLCTAAVAEEWEPLPLSGAAPYGPVEGALSADGLSYDDGTLSVRVEKDVFNGTNVYYVYVMITDPTQLRTYFHAQALSSKTAKPSAMAQACNAVLAINGDFYTFQDSKPGIIYRNGEMIRDNPVTDYDELFIDEKGDLTVVAWPVSLKQRRRDFEAYADDVMEAYTKEHTLIHAFAFGPALIADGEALEIPDRDKVSCGYRGGDQRMVLCQLDTLSYLIVACESKRQGGGQTGLTVPEITQLCLEKGAVQAYNMDGGNSTAIILCGQRINGYNEYDSLAKEREIKDIIYFATLRSE